MEIWERWWFLASCVVAGVLVVEVARWRLGRWFRSHRSRQRVAKAHAGEVAAEDLLKSQGYRIAARQPRRTWSLEIDGESRDVELRADLLVKRGGRLFVAEVKTGAEAPRLETATTRRQLLEYRLAYDVHGVILVDMNAEVLHEVVFPLGEPHRGETLGRVLLWFALGAALGVAAASFYS